MQYTFYSRFICTLSISCDEYHLVMKEVVPSSRKQSSSVLESSRPRSTAPVTANGRRRVLCANMCVVLRYRTFAIHD